MYLLNLIDKTSFLSHTFYRSARSMAGSGTPPFRTYMRAARSGPSAMTMDSDSSSEDESTPVTSNKNSVTQSRPIPRSVSLENLISYL